LQHQLRAHPSRGPRVGSVIGFHGLVMNGGLAHSLEVDYAQASRAAAAFLFLGSKDLGRLIDDACNVGAPLADDPDADLTADQEARLDELERRYNELIPSDSRLAEIFRTYLNGHADQFEPLR
jgi:hypothetical protein